MLFKASALPVLFLLTLAFSTLQAPAQSSYNQTNSTSSPCPSPTGFANTIIRAPLPSSPRLQVSPSFLSENILFFFTDQNTALSQAAFASFCLDQCVGYQPDPNATDIVTNPPPVLPAFYVTNRPGPCRSFTVDMGKPYPPNPSDTATRWYCEGFGEYFEEDESDFVPVDAPGSYMYGLGVNRACGGDYRAY